MKNIGALFELLRWKHSLLIAAGLIVSGILSGDLAGLQPEYVVGFIIAFLIASGSFAINDFYDVKIDALNGKQDRPLVSGLLNKRQALLTAIVAFVAVFFLTFLINPAAQILVMASLSTYYLYSISLKKIFFLKNVLIAGAYPVVILLGTILTDSIIEPLIIYFALMGFIVGLAAEILADIADVDGDGMHGINTLATRLGVAAAARVSVVLFTVIIVMDPLPFFIELDANLNTDYIFLLVVLIPMLSYFFISRALMDKTGPDVVRGLKKRVINTMQIGSAAYIIGVLL